MQQFNYLPAQPGAGKTKWVLSNANTISENKYSIIAILPTKALCDEYAKRSEGLFQAIHSGKDTQNLMDDIGQVIADSKFTPQYLAITYESYKKIPLWHNKDEWISFVDEPKNPLEIHEFYINDSKEFIEKHFISQTEEDGNFFRITELKPESFRYMNKKDMVYGNLAKLRAILNDDRFDVLFDKKSYEKGILLFSVLIKPKMYSGFKETNFLSAFFQYSAMYSLYDTKGIKWKEITHILQDIDSRRLRIHYMDDKGRNSKHWRKQGKQTNNLTRYIKWIKKHVKGDYLFVFNKDVNADLDGTEIVSECHGLNQYKDYTQIVLGGTYLSNDYHNAFYAYYGLSSKDMLVMRHMHYIIQQLTRTDIRNRESDKIIHVYVPTKQDALDILGFLPDATILNQKGHEYQLKDNFSMGSIIKEPIDETAIEYFTYGYKANQPIPFQRKIEPVVKTRSKEAIKKQKYREKNKKGTLLTFSGGTLKDIQCGVKNDIFCPLSMDFFNQMIELGKDTSISHLDMNDSNYKKLKDDFKKNNIPWITNGVMGKVNSTLISIGAENYTQYTTERLKKENIKGSTFLAFDFDATPINPKTITKLLKNNIYMQYSTITDREHIRLEDSENNPDHINLYSFRIIMPYDRVVSIEEHNLIRDYYFKLFDKLVVIPDDVPEDKLREYLKKHTGLDKDKSNAGVKLFVPHKESTIKIVKKKRNGKATVLKVDELLANLPKKPKFTLPTEKDVIWINAPKVTNKQAHSPMYRKHIDKIFNIYDDMGAGNRTIPAITIAGLAQYFNTDEKITIISMLESKGVDAKAMKTVLEFIKLNE